MVLESQSSPLHHHTHNFLHDISKVIFSYMYIRIGDIMVCQHGYDVRHTKINTGLHMALHGRTQPSGKGGGGGGGGSKIYKRWPFVTQNYGYVIFTKCTYVYTRTCTFSHAYVE